MKARVTQNTFLGEPQGKTFIDVVNDPEQPFDEAICFFDSADRQRRMEESELHHDRPPLSGVVRELESQPVVNEFLASGRAGCGRRFRQAIGVLVRMIMERRGWQKTGRKGSLGVRTKQSESQSTPHNTGGLAFWFLRAERYERSEGMPFSPVREQRRKFESAAKRLPRKGKV
ncbi:MAG: hypothetical protein ACI9VS_001411 [Candidatus Binatia bacterium]|jgi:hypothetical protein